MKTKRLLSFLLLAIGMFFITSCEGFTFPTKLVTTTTTVTETTVISTDGTTSTTTKEETSTTTKTTTTITTSTTSTVTETTTEEPTTSLTTTTVTIYTETTTSVSSESSSSSSSIDSSSSTTQGNDEDDKYSDLIKEGIYSGSYYDRVTDEVLNNPELLKSTLTTITNEGYTRKSYDNAWTSLGTVDSYDGYYVECIYTGQRMGKTDHGSSAGLWNREHIWAKAYGFKDEVYDAYSDIQHLRVSEYTINNYRSSSYFGEVNSTGASKDQFGNTWTSTVFEPRDEVKGDVARMLLYMTVKYNDPSKLDLELTDDISLITGSESVFGGARPSNAAANRTYREGEIYLGVLSTLLKWHYMDPVDSREIHRNNEIYENWQNNRNPFIDHPEYVYYLYTAESQEYIETQEDLEYLSTHYVSYNDEGVEYMNSLIDAIGTVTLESQDYIEYCVDEYYKLGQVTKSFVSEYHTFDLAQIALSNLIDHSNRDETQPASFSFLNQTQGNAGELQSNGVGLTYSGGSYNSTYGIYATTNQKALNISLSNLYPSIVSLSITADTNKAQKDLTGKENFKIKITDSKGASVERSFVPPVTKNSQTFTVDISSLDLTGDLTVVINAAAGYSLRVTELILNVS